MLGSNPSADSGPKTEAGCRCWHPVSRSAGLRPPFWEQRVKSRGPGGRVPRSTTFNTTGTAGSPKAPILSNRAVRPQTLLDRCIQIDEEPKNLCK
jgi:hypothetical protein